ncbi:MAG: CDP-glucose 4,6-dehydratase [Edaphobacter sp.]|nr:CDP-glucose 4,6-dehydratase [Edaphobacter sp.]
MNWKGKRVFLTGHTGFKGSWLSLWLQSSGAIVRGYSLEPPTSQNLFEAGGVANGMESCIGDIRDQAHLQRELKAFQPEVVIHMAAQPLVRLSYSQPLETYAVNVMGTANLLEAVRATEGVRSVVIVTTDKCYENREWLWAYRENDRLGGYDPYSSSKAAAEMVTSSYRSSFFPPEKYHIHGVAVATVRAGNVIGGGDWALDRLIPDIIRSFHAGTPVLIRNPHAIRPWQHVLEPLRGYLMLAEALYDQGPRYGEGWNFGPRDLQALPVQKIVELMGSLWGEEADWVLEDQPQVHEAALLRLDWSKAAKELQWLPVFSIEEALKFTISWYSAWRQEKNMREFTLRQIEEYEHLARS